jgi:hypothetical protein
VAEEGGPFLSEDIHHEFKISQNMFFLSPTVIAILLAFDSPLPDDIS